MACFPYKIYSMIYTEVFKYDMSDVSNSKLHEQVNYIHETSIRSKTMWLFMSLTVTLAEWGTAMISSWLHYTHVEQQAVPVSVSMRVMH